MKIVITNGSARKGNTLATINAFAKGASAANEKDELVKDAEVMKELETLGRDIK